MKPALETGHFFQREENMKDAFKMAAAAIFATVVLIVVGVMLSGANLEMTRFFGTRMESIKTDIYRENKSYIEGTRRDIREMMVEYYAAETDAHKDAISSLILHRSAELDRDRLPEELRTFIESLEAR